MTAISIHELHENTDAWVRRATEQEPVVLTDNGRAVAKIVPVAGVKQGNPFLTRKLLPGFAELHAKLSGGTDSTQIISEMRDGR
jgi:prevent-host-death family protein